VPKDPNSCDVRVICYLFSIPTFRSLYFAS
jgi:hypothetical protein